MTNFFIIVLFLYVLYYVGMITYDMFLKKDKVNPEDDDKAEFSLADMVDNTITNVNFDDVEQMTTSSSMSVDEETIFSSATEEANEDKKANDDDLQTLKRKYDEEERLDNPNNDEDENTGGKALENELIPQITELNKADFSKSQREYFFNMLNLAKTNVQTVFNSDGEKIYKSNIL